jgi:hypothetical protein
MIFIISVRAHATLISNFAVFNVYVSAVNACYSSLPCSALFVWSHGCLKSPNTNVFKTRSYVWHSFILNDLIPERIKEICSRSPLHNVCLVRYVPSVMAEEGGGWVVGETTAL